MVEGVDAVEYEVVFDRAISELGGQPVRVEFTPANARLYSFSVQESDSE